GRATGRARLVEVGTHGAAGAGAGRAPGLLRVPAGRLAAGPGQREAVRAALSRDRPATRDRAAHRRLRLAGGGPAAYHPTDAGRPYRRTRPGVHATAPATPA